MAIYMEILPAASWSSRVKFLQTGKICGQVDATILLALAIINCI